MKIYIDYIFFINFLFNLIILFFLSFFLKRNVNFIRIFLGAFIGSFSIFILFVPLNEYLFFFLKILFGFLMVIISFKYKCFKYTFTNFLYLMIISVLVGGFLYFINIQVGYEHVGMIFYTNGKSLNIFILILLCILFMIIFIKKTKKTQKETNYNYKINLYIGHKCLKLNGYLDSGNNLFDPYFNKPILIINNNINIKNDKYFFVPFHTLNSKGMLKCFKIKKIYIYNVGYRYNVIVGQSEKYLNLEGIDIILNKEII